MNPKKRDFYELIRHDLYAFTRKVFHELNPATPFLPNWHIEVVTSELERCRRGEANRLIINQPPRSLKSCCGSVSYVAFHLGHDPTAQIICSSYGQDLANKHALDCRRVMSSKWYRDLFPRTKLTSDRQAVQELTTTQNGFRLATSVGGVLTGRWGDTIIVDDPEKPDEALSEAQRKTVNEWFDHSLYSRMNDKQQGRIIIIMQRLHEDDLVGHVLRMEPWRLIRLPAIAEEDEIHEIQTPYGTRRFARRVGEALHAEREPLEVLNQLRQAQGEYNFAGQYQQSPAPLGGGMVQEDWFRTYSAIDSPSKFDLVFQSWDTANKPTELSDYSVCTTWRVRDKQLFLVNVYRKRLGYPDLKRAVRDQAGAFGADTVLIEDKASGTQLIQELVSEGMHEIKKYEPTMDKIMRMHSVTSTIENGFVYLPDKASWRSEYLHEIVTFPNGKYDDQVDSTSQALDWFKNSATNFTPGLIEWEKQEASKLLSKELSIKIPESMVCRNCSRVMSQLIPGVFRCMNCGAEWSLPGLQRIVQPNRTDTHYRRFAWRPRSQ